MRVHSLHLAGVCSVCPHFTSISQQNGGKLTGDMLVQNNVMSGSSNTVLEFEELQDANVKIISNWFEGREGGERGG